MKNALNIFIILGVIAASFQASAGVGRFNSDEFNAIISENLKAESELREQLRQNAGVPDLSKEMNPNFAEKGRELVGIAPSENIAAPTTDHREARKDRAVEKKALENSMERVSEEMDSFEH